MIWHRQNSVSTTMEGHLHRSSYWCVHDTRVHASNLKIRNPMGWKRRSRTTLSLCNRSAGLCLYDWPLAINGFFLFLLRFFLNIPSLRCQETARIRLRRNCSAPEQRIYWSTGCLNIGVKSICFSLWLYPLIQKSTLHPNRSSLERWAGEKNKSRNGASGPTLRGKKKRGVHSFCL